MALIGEGGLSPSLVLQDMNFSRLTSGEEGLDLLQRTKALRKDLPVVLMTAWGSIALAVKGIQAGASDFITKPWTNPQLLQTVKTALELAAAGEAARMDYSERDDSVDARATNRPRDAGRSPESAGADPESSTPSIRTSPRTQNGGIPTHRSRAELDAAYDFRDIVGDHPRLVAVLDLVGRISGTDASVLITGESGTGKELIAEAIHRNSTRRSGPFVKVNLGGVPIGLFESEMFGHVKGAFTDARQDRKGRFEAASGGTVFLDEIGELDPASQVKLLRVLQDRSYEVLGSSVTRTVDVRVISATNRNLAEAVAGGAFREDLLYRINLITACLPPLRERISDVPRLVERFLEKLSAAYGRGPLAIDAAALRWLRERPWPGNIRQLRQVIERAVLLSPAATLTVDTLLQSAQTDIPPSAQDLPDVGSMTMDEIEMAMIVKSLKHHAGNISRVAESLGMSRAALYRRLQKYGLDSE